MFAFRRGPCERLTSLDTPRQLASDRGPLYPQSSPPAVGLCDRHCDAEIDALFGDNDIRLGPEQPDLSDPSERRERMRRYLATLDLNNPADHAKLVAVYSDVMQDIGERSKRRGDYYDLMPLKARWLNTLAGAGFEVDPWSFVVTDPSRPATSVTFSSEALAALSDPTVIHDHLVRLGDTVESDPRLAVSTAKALIESTAKCVLSARGVAYSKSDDVTQLVARPAGSRARGQGSEWRGPVAPARLGITRHLGAERHRDTQQDWRRSRVRECRATWVRPRHARLVVGAAQVWCQLMLETLGDPDAPWRAAHVTSESPEARARRQIRMVRSRASGPR